MRRTPIVLSVLVQLALLAGCTSPTPPPPERPPVERYGRPGEPLERKGDEIVACGQLFHTGAPVVLWTDPGGYDAYRVECRFDPEATLPKKSSDPTPNRYATLRKHLPPDVAVRVGRDGFDLPTLARFVDLFVLHYDVAGTSRRCFEILHDWRGLSVHFLLDVDGTIYQTLDLKERAWHAGSANDRSIGIEIANIGAYEDRTTLDQWYVAGGDGRPVLTLPERLGDGGIRTPGFVGRPARDEPVLGTIQGRRLVQYDLTDAQYESLVLLAATLCRILPAIRPEAPRTPDGAVAPGVLTPEEQAAFSGILGHYHVSRSKVDPGPAFDWERLLTGVRQHLAPSAPDLDAGR